MSWCRALLLRACRSAPIVAMLTAACSMSAAMLSCAPGSSAVVAAPSAPATAEVRSDDRSSEMGPALAASNDSMSSDGRAEATANPDGLTSFHRHGVPGSEHDAERLDVAAALGGELTGRGGATSVAELAVPAPAELAAKQVAP